MADVIVIYPINAIKLRTIEKNKKMVYGNTGETFDETESRTQHYSNYIKDLFQFHDELPFVLF